MNAIFQFQLKHSGNRYVLSLTGAMLLFVGWFCGYKFNLTAGEGIYLNSPYTIGFMMALLSLSIIFFFNYLHMNIMNKSTSNPMDLLR